MKFFTSKEGLAVIVLSIISINMYGMENERSKKYYFNQTVTKNSYDNKVLFSCTIEKPLTPETDFIKGSLLVGCEIRESVINKTVNMAADMAARFISRPIGMGKCIEDSLCVWIDISQCKNIRFKKCIILGLETQELPDDQDKVLVITKGQIKAFCACLGLGGLLFLAKNH